VKFIRKKNLLDTEDLLFIPSLHWMYTLRHTVRFMFFILGLLVLAAVDSYFHVWNVIFLVNDYFDSMILAAILVELFILAWDIFSFITTEYGITSRRLLIKKGIIRVWTAEISADRIESIYCYQGILGRIFRFGTISISGVGGKMPVFFMVSRPFLVRNKIVQVIEKNKT